VRYRAGRYDAAIQVLEPAAETFRAAGNWESLGRVTAWMGRAHSLRGTPHEGVALITALLERLDRSGASPPSLGALYEALGWLLRAYLDLGYIQTLRGAVASGRLYIERALALAMQMGDPGQHAFALAFRGWFAGLSGTWGDARTDLDQAVALSRQVDRSLYSA